MQTSLRTTILRLLAKAEIEYTQRSTKPRTVNHIEIPARSFIEFDLERNEYAIEPPTEHDLCYIHTNPHHGGDEDAISMGYPSDDAVLETLNEIIEARQ